jgi:hypothetical protein
MNRSSMLWHLEETLKERGDEYGAPEENFGRIAALWSEWLQIEVTEPDVGVMMMLFKIARLQSKRDHADSYLDIAGYAMLTLEVAQNSRK